MIGVGLSLGRMMRRRASGTAFSLTIPMAGLFDLTFNGNATVQFSIVNRGQDGDHGVPTSGGSGGASGCFVNSLARSVLSGDTVSLNMPTTGGTYAYLTKGAATILQAGFNDVGNSGDWLDGVSRFGNGGGLYSANAGGSGASAPTISSNGADGVAASGSTGGIAPAGAGNGGNVGLTGANATVTGCGGGGGGKGAGNPAGGAGKDGTFVAYGTTAGGGLYCPTLIKSITNNGSNKPRLATIGPHGLGPATTIVAITFTSADGVYINAGTSVTVVDSITLDSDAAYLSGANGVSGADITAVGFLVVAPP